MNKPPKSRRLLWVILSVVLVLGLFGLVLYQTGVLPKYFRSKDVVARVGNHYITKQEVQKTYDDAVKAGFSPQSKETVRNLIMTYWLYTLIAKEYNINVSDKEALEYFKASGLNSNQNQQLDPNNSYVRYRAYNSILLSNLTNYLYNPGSGSFVIAHFSQNLQRISPEMKAPSRAQYDELIANDKKYATDFINNIYNKLKAGNIDMAKAMQLEIDEPKIGEKPMPYALHSSSFGKTSDNDKGQTNFTIASSPEFKEKVKGMKAGEISQPIAISAPVEFAEGTSSVEVYWLIVKMDRVNNRTPKFDNTNQALQYFNKKYGYEIYN